MIYRLLRKVVGWALSIFYYKIVLTGQEHLIEKGPMVIVSNHPNTLMDPLVIASLMKQRIGFLGNGGLFQNKVLAAFLRFFHVIPIYRRKDIKKSQKGNNADSFRACHEYFNEKGSILIFPEGSSYYELNLREIKTGTARISLSYETLKAFNGQLKILPIALDYSDSLLFRSVLAVRVSEPIDVSAYQQEYEEEEVKGVKALTGAIREKLAESIPLTDDKEQEAFLKDVHRFYSSFCFSEAKLYADPFKSLELRRQISRALMVLKEDDRGHYDEIRTKLQSFYQMLEREKLSAGFFTDDFQKKNTLGVHLALIAQLLLLFPIYLFGLITNYLPYILPSKLFNLLKIDVEYKTSFALIAGLVLFPIFYGLEIAAFRNWVSLDLFLTLLFALLLPIAGYLAMYYWRVVKRMLKLLRYSRKRRTKEEKSLQDLKNQLVGKIEKISIKLEQASQ